MATTTEPENLEPTRGSKRSLYLGLLLAVLGGGGAFYAMYSGLLFGEQTNSAKMEAPVEATPMPDVAFVPIDPLVVSLGPTAINRHLRFRAQLEVVPAHEQDVIHLLPRIVDVLNNYLRALEASDIEQPAALMNLRAQMLRRVQIVVGPGRVNDLLVMEFVLK
ncbi:flagellar basal body-associated FliL family protein [Shimia thalassica]|uniref:flagellar basal body-associated FliL family protein n=1 Tax=Shimia thalassica TaxID=1715693 RepID=UPI0027363FA4|nr:flagellar basal body-associated FliL family protein [Shimia thalassica]MDP2581203.1 flagellar basal body-associated FliL family protein [Shimia thalassica]